MLNPRNAVDWKVAKKRPNELNVNALTRDRIKWIDTKIEKTTGEIRFSAIFAKWQIQI